MEKNHGESNEFGVLWATDLRLSFVRFHLPGPKSLDTLHHLYVYYHKHFFGDTNACLALANAYLSRRMDLLQRKCSKDILKVKTFDDGILQNQSTKMFLKKIDAAFESGLTTLTFDFQNH